MVTSSRMNITQISSIYQAVEGLTLAGVARVNPKTAMKNTMKIFGVVAIAIFLLGSGAGIAEAQAASSVSGITCNSAVLQGNISPSPVGTPTDVWFEWGSSTAFGNTTLRMTYASYASFSELLTGLYPSTTYYYRAVSQNNVFGLSSGATSNFTTPSCSGGYGQSSYPNYYGTGNLPAYNGSTWGNQPIVYTYSPTTSGNSAMLNGYVNTNGYSTVTRWFEWGNDQYYFQNSTPRISQSSTGAWSESIVNLSANTTYYYRAVVQSTGGVVYGQVMSLTTDANYTNTAPYNYGYTNSNITVPRTEVITNSPEVLGETAVRLNGTVVLRNNSAQTNTWFEWGDTTSLGKVTETRMAGINQSVIFNNTISELSGGMTYYYRAVAQNQYGIFRGDTTSFRTTQRPAVVYAPSPSVVYAPAPEPRVVYVTEPAVSYRTVGAEEGTSKMSLVKISIYSDNGLVCRGERESFTATYINTSSHTLKDVVLRVELPLEMRYQDSGRGSFSAKDNILTVDVGTLAPGESGQTIVKAEVAKSPTTDREVITTASVVYTEPSGYQNEVVSYVAGKSDCVSSNVALALYGGNFLPDTFAEWALLTVVILALIVLSRYLYGTYQKEKKEKEAKK